MSETHASFDKFIADFGRLLDRKPDEARIINEGGALLASLVSTDDWLPKDFTQPHRDHYQQYLLHLDPDERFSVVSFVWGPGQFTPIHDHEVWGLIGMLRGSEISQSFPRDAQGKFTETGESITLSPGQVVPVSPTVGDIHRVYNMLKDDVSISIHVYGANIGTVRRSIYNEDGVARPFVSGYAQPGARTLDYASVRNSLLARHEIALIDVREEHPFAQEHPLWAANFPLSTLDLNVARRLPRKDVTIVIYGEHDGVDLAPLALKRLSALGYSDIYLLKDGLQGWKNAGGEVFRDVNVPSKAFGELVESERHTPSLSAEEVQKLIDDKADIVILDARRFDEYQTMSIPTATSVPGAELALRVRDLAPNASTRVIVNCAGRTRSIIGTQSLVNAGIPNKVAALRNGTIGWTLAGQKLDHGADRRIGDVSTEAHQIAASSARALADRAGVQQASFADIKKLEDRKRSVYFLDVRTPEEYAAGHVPGFASAPGGQLIQETDHVVPVRGARIVLADDDGVRANMSASWLAQMGWEVHVLRFNCSALTETGPGESARPSQPNPNRYRRPYEGTDAPREAMQAYLDWEYGLVEQLGRDGTHHFKVI